jgi:hypothetical protein
LPPCAASLLRIHPLGNIFLPSSLNLTLRNGRPTYVRCFARSGLRFGPLKGQRRLLPGGTKVYSLLQASAARSTISRVETTDCSVSLPALSRMAQSDIIIRPSRTSLRLPSSGFLRRRSSPIAPKMKPPSTPAPASLASIRPQTGPSHGVLPQPTPPRRIPHSISQSSMSSKQSNKPGCPCRSGSWRRSDRSLPLLRSSTRHWTADG